MKILSIQRTAKLEEKHFLIRPSVLFRYCQIVMLRWCFLFKNYIFRTQSHEMFNTILEN